MADAVLSKAAAIWEGDLIHGKGTFTLDSGTVPTLPITWASRTQRGKGATSPEELLAGAHASCFAMAFSHALAQSGHPATRLDVSATVAFAPVPSGGFKIASVDLQVRGQAPGLDQAGFEEAARGAEQGCPVSNALRGNVEIQVTAHLEG